MREGFDVGLKLVTRRPSGDMIDNMAHGGKIVAGYPYGTDGVSIGNKVVFNMLTIMYYGREMYETCIK